MAQAKKMTPDPIRSQRARDWLVNCALEGIYPTEETLADLVKLDSGDMTPDQFLHYITAKYRTNSSN